MYQPHLRALEQQLLTKTDAKKIDSFNNQLLHSGAKENPIYPAVYIDFGTVAWKPLSNGIKEGTANITIHCVHTGYRQTHATANDNDHKRLQRYDWSEKVLAALDGYAAKDSEGNFLFRPLQLLEATMDTNHDALRDDTLTFSTRLYYFNIWRELNWQTITITGIQPIPDPAIL